jgi:DNA-binding response OmpR family regulator
MTLRSGPIEVDLTHSTALIGGQALTLTVHEFRLLCVLIERAGRVVMREDLYRAAWGGALRRGDRCVDVYVRKLRVKLAEALPDWTCIHTHVGFGYRLHPERSHVFHSTATPR